MWTRECAFLWDAFWTLPLPYIRLCWAESNNSAHHARLQTAMMYMLWSCECCKFPAFRDLAHKWQPFLHPRPTSPPRWWRGSTKLLKQLEGPALEVATTVRTQLQVRYWGSD